MCTRRLDLVKGDERVTLTEQAHIDAYKAKGWQEAVKAAPAAPVPKRKKKEG